MHNFKKFLVVTGCCLLGVSLLGGCKKKNDEPSVIESTSDSTEESTSVSTEELELVDLGIESDREPLEEGEIYSFLTGEPVQEETGLRRPLAIMFNNLSVACPQTGISRSGVVYEAPVEGYITRLMGIMENYDDLEKIGSVRSARTYFVHYAVEFDAIYAHIGQAYNVLPYFKAGKVDYLSGLEGVGNLIFYRTSDRKAPHNAYASGEGVLDGIAYKKYRSDYEEGYEGHYLFADNEVTLEDGEVAEYVEPGYPTNKPWFEYNEEDGLYYRFQYGKSQIDDLDGEQLTCKNIILQYSDGRVFDSKGRWDIDETSGGKGKYITNGKMIDITWKKESEWSKTLYFDESGEELKINPGKTWVCIVINTNLDRVDISASK